MFTSLQLALLLAGVVVFAVLIGVLTAWLDWPIQATILLGGATGLAWGIYVASLDTNESKEDR